MVSIPSGVRWTTRACSASTRSSVANPLRIPTRWSRSRWSKNMADLENTLYLDVANAKGEPKGRVTIELRPDLAPNHVARIKELAREGAYDGVVFHRVIEGFMAQTGDVKFGKSGS